MQSAKDGWVIIMEPGDRVGSEITYQVSRGNSAEALEPPDPVKAEIQPGDGLPTGSFRIEAFPSMPRMNR